MKSKFTTTFALLGVLATGTAAAAVNTQALQSHSESSIGAGSTTLITPISVDPTTQEIQLDAIVAPAVPTPAVTKASKKPAGKASVSSRTPSVNNDDAEDDDSDENEDYDDD